MKIHIEIDTRENRGVTDYERGVLLALAGVDGPKESGEHQHFEKPVTLPQPEPEPEAAPPAEEPTKAEAPKRRTRRTKAELEQAKELEAQGYSAEDVKRHQLEGAPLPELPAAEAAPEPAAAPQQATPEPEPQPEPEADEGEAWQPAWA